MSKLKTVRDLDDDYYLWKDRCFWYPYSSSMSNAQTTSLCDKLFTMITHWTRRPSRLPIMNEYNTRFSAPYRSKHKKVFGCFCFVASVACRALSFIYLFKIPKPLKKKKKTFRAANSCFLLQTWTFDLEAEFSASEKWRLIKLLFENRMSWLNDVQTKIRDI